MNVGLDMTMCSRTDYTSYGPTTFQIPRFDALELRYLINPYRYVFTLRTPLVLESLAVEGECCGGRPRPLLYQRLSTIRVPRDPARRVFAAREPHLTSVFYRDD